MAAVLREIEERNLHDVLVTTSGCAGPCSREPMMTVEVLGEAPVKYVDLTEGKVKEIFAEHIVGGRIADRLRPGGGQRTDHVRRTEHALPCALHGLRRHGLRFQPLP